MLSGFSKLLSNSGRIMKKIIAGMVLAVLFWSCQENEAIDAAFTGNETVYALQAGSTYPINGTATFREKKDGSTVISILLTGTEGNVQHPVHLHLGTLATPDADVAALLTPVFGSSGKSETTLTLLADETTITYNQLISLDACIKIHLAEAGSDRDIILAGGNIGNSTAAKTSDRIAVCKSDKSE
jgi:hypothetical protein